MLRRYHYFYHGKTQKERKLRKSENRLFKNFHRKTRAKLSGTRRYITKQFLKQISIDSSDEEIDKVLSQAFNARYTGLKWGEWDWD